MQRSSNDVWVGLLVLIGTAALLFLALQSANLLSLNFDQLLKGTKEVQLITQPQPVPPDSMPQDDDEGTATTSAAASP